MLFSPLALRLPRLGKKELILMLFVRLFDLCLFGFVGFLFLLLSGKAAVCECGTPWTFSLTFVFIIYKCLRVGGNSVACVDKSM